MDEVGGMDAVENPVLSEISWEPEFSKYVWYAKQDENETVISANFQECDCRYVLL